MCVVVFVVLSTVSAESLVGVLRNRLKCEMKQERDGIRMDVSAGFADWLSSGFASDRCGFFFFFFSRQASCFFMLSMSIMLSSLLLLLLLFELREKQVARREE